MMQVSVSYVAGNVSPAKSLLRVDVFRLRAFLAVCDSELNLLTIGQGLEPITLNSAEVYKDVWSIFLCDKTVAFRFVKPLHGARYC